MFFVLKNLLTFSSWHDSTKCDVKRWKQGLCIVNLEWLLHCKNWMWSNLLHPALKNCAAKVAEFFKQTNSAPNWTAKLDVCDCITSVFSQPKMANKAAQATRSIAGPELWTGLINPAQLWWLQYSRYLFSTKKLDLERHALIALEGKLFSVQRNKMMCFHLMCFQPIHQPKKYEKVWKSKKFQLVSGSCLHWD